MNKEKLKNRLAEIEKAMQQTSANYNMLEGGKSETLYWLAELEKEDEPPKSSIMHEVKSAS